MRRSLYIYLHYLHWSDNLYCYWFRMSHVVFSKDSCKNTSHHTRYSTMCPGRCSHPEMRSIAPFEPSGFGMTSTIENGKNPTVWLPRLGHKCDSVSVLFAGKRALKSPQLPLKKGWIPGHCVMGWTRADILVSSPSLPSFSRLWVGLQVTPALSHWAPLAFTSSQLRPHTSRGRRSYPFLELLFSCSVASDLCSPVDCNPPGSSVHVISQARILGWVAISFSRFFFFFFFWCWDQTHVSCIGRRVLYSWATREGPQLSLLCCIWIANPQNLLAWQDYCFKLLSLGLICLAAVVPGVEM